MNLCQSSLAKALVCPQSVKHLWASTAHKSSRMNNNLLWMVDLLTGTCVFISMLLTNSHAGEFNISSTSGWMLRTSLLETKPQHSCSYSKTPFMNQINLQDKVRWYTGDAQILGVPFPNCKTNKTVGRSQRMTGKGLLNTFPAIFSAHNH